jgi:lysophospholipid acyltransferase (LPLAT)-like uncharacterized protein
MEANPASEKWSDFTLWQRAKIGAISLTGFLLIWLIGKTLRIHFKDKERLDQFRARRQAVILTFWHNQIFSQTYLFRFQQIVVMTSRHFDGEYIGRIIGSFGYGTARGSSTRGAVRALLELNKHLAEGRDVALTVDGPRGPVYRAKAGSVFLARKSGAPIIPMHCEPEAFWELNSWDRFRIPKPFTRVLLKFGEPIFVSPQEDESACVKRFQDELDRIRLYCESGRRGRDSFTC